MSRSGGLLLPWSRTTVLWELGADGSLSLASNFAVVKMQPGEWLSDAGLWRLCGGSVGVPLLASASRFGGGDVLLAELRRGLAEPVGAARELSVALALSAAAASRSAESLARAHAARAADPGTGAFRTSQQKSREVAAENPENNQPTGVGAAKTRNGEEAELVRQGRIAEAVSAGRRTDKPVPPAGRVVAKGAKAPDASIGQRAATAPTAALPVVPVAASAFEPLPPVPASVRHDVRSAVLVGVPGVELLLAETSAIRGSSVVAALVAGRVGEGVSRRLLDLGDPSEVAAFVDSLSASRRVEWSACAASLLSGAASLGTRIELRSESVGGAA